MGTSIVFDKDLIAEALQSRGDGIWEISFNHKGRRLWRDIYDLGEVPLPPYIKREKPRQGDINDYQTVFANPKKTGSVAAPTAGLHFTEEVLKNIKARGVKIVYVTLHVGLGTFAPIKADNILDHKMHSEWAEISSSSGREIIKAKREGRRVIAVGTTSARTLESMDLHKEGAQSFWTDIFIYPGYRFKAVDALLTNFHLPCSTLLMLVSALAGKKTIDKAYSQAVQLKYRFFSYGDAMFIF